MDTMPEVTRGEGGGGLLKKKLSDYLQVTVITEYIQICSNTHKYSSYITPCIAYIVRNSPFFVIFTDKLTVFQQDYSHEIISRNNVITKETDRELITLTLSFLHLP